MMTIKSLLSMFKSKLRLVSVYLLVIPISFLLKNIRTRVFFVRVDRFGHLALNTHLFFIRHKLHRAKKRSLLIFPSKHSRRVSNKELMLMFIEYAAQRKHVHTYSSSFLHIFLDLFKHEFTKRGVCLDLPMDSREEEFQLGVSTIKFDAYRNDQERERMEAWNLTAKTVMHVDQWKQFFLDVGYTGDYYWFIP